MLRGYCFCCGGGLSKERFKCWYNHLLFTRKEWTVHIEVEDIKLWYARIDIQHGVCRFVAAAHPLPISLFIMECYESSSSFRHLVFHYSKKELFRYMVTWIFSIVPKETLFTSISKSIFVFLLFTSCFSSLFSVILTKSDLNTTWTLASFEIGYMALFWLMVNFMVYSLCSTELWLGLPKSTGRRLSTKLIGLSAGWNFRSGFRWQGLPNLGWQPRLRFDFGFVSLQNSIRRFPIFISSLHGSSLFEYLLESRMKSKLIRRIFSLGWSQSCTVVIFSKVSWRSSKLDILLWSKIKQMQMVIAKAKTPITFFLKFDLGRFELLLSVFNSSMFSITLRV